MMTGRTLGMRSSAAAILFGIALGAFAQNTTIKPFARTLAPRPVVESTLDVFPQINDTMSQRPMRPRNPSVDIPLGPPNSLPTGQVIDAQRTRPESLFPGITATGWTPPDPDIAVGPNHVVQIVNSAVAFFDKRTGQRLFQQDLGRIGFFGSVGAGDFVYDPKAFYDQGAGRFVIVVLDLDTNRNLSHFLFAISDDNNPNGTWYKYRIDAKATIDNAEYWLDYPGFGYNKDAYVVCGNMFGFGGGFGAVQFFVIPKRDVLNGGQPTITRFLDREIFTVQMARTFDAVTPFVFGVAVETSSRLQVYAVRNLDAGQTPELVKTPLTVPSMSFNVRRPSSRGGALLDAIPGRMMTCAYRTGRLVATHTIGVGGNDSRSMVRWYEILTNQFPQSGGVTLGQAGDIRPPAGQFYFMPAIASNLAGDISVIFSRSSPDIAADVMVASRRRTDPPGAMGQPVQVATSAGTYPPTANRWGDYFGIQTDPVNDIRFWGNGQIIRANGSWGTFITSWTVTDEPGGGGGPGVIRPKAITVLRGNPLGGALGNLNGIDGSTFDIGSTLGSTDGEAAGAEIVFESDQGAAQLQLLTFEFAGFTLPDVNATGMIWVWNLREQRWEHLRSFRLRDRTSGILALSLNRNFADYVDSNREIKFAVRGLSPFTRRGVPPAPFKFRLDYAGLRTQ